MPSMPVFALTPYCRVLNKETTDQLFEKKTWSSLVKLLLKGKKNISIQ
jgi:hypothetical protein